LHSVVGNHRIALGHFEAREALPFLDERVALGHKLAKARSLLHVGRDADAAQTADEALELAARSSVLEAYRGLALDRAALYNLSAGRFERAAALYAEGAARVDAEPGALGRRNQLVHRLGHAAAALGAKQPAAALADLALVDRQLADARSLGARRWRTARSAGCPKPSARSTGGASCCSCATSARTSTRTWRSSPPPRRSSPRWRARAAICRKRRARRRPGWRTPRSSASARRRRSTRRSSTCCRSPPSSSSSAARGRATSASTWRPRCATRTSSSPGSAIRRGARRSNASPSTPRCSLSTARAELPVDRRGAAGE